MKQLLIGATALSLLAATPALAEDTTPSMDVEIVTQDTMGEAEDGSVLVPILMMVFMTLTAA